MKLLSSLQCLSEIAWIEGEEIPGATEAKRGCSWSRDLVIDEADCP